MVSVLWIGIDNGASGAISFLYPDGRVFAQTTPTVKLMKDREFIDDLKLVALIREHIASAGADRVHVTFEMAQTQPLFSTMTNFKQGWGAGVIFCVLRQLGVPATGVHPRTWQDYIFRGVRKKGEDTKVASIRYCHQNFPQVSLKASPRCRVDHDGIADSLCLLDYGRRKNL